MTGARNLPVVLTAALGALLTMLAIFVSLTWERQVATLAFQANAREYLNGINSDLQRADNLLEVTRALFEAHAGPVGVGEFSIFATDLRRQTAGLRDIGWAPRVTSGQRAAFERDMRTTLGGDFEILELGADHKPVRAGDRPEYFPIVFYENGGNPHRPKLGFDVASGPARGNAVARAIRSDHAAATVPTALVSLPHPKSGVLSYIPVYNGGRRTGPSQRPDGLIVGAFEIAGLLENIPWARLHQTGFDMYVFDPADPPGQQLIYWRSSETDRRPVPSEASLSAGPHWLGTVSVMDQTWGAIVVPDGGLVTNSGWWVAGLSLALGTLTTVAAVCYLLVSARRTSQLQALAASLRETTIHLDQKAREVEHLAGHDPLTGLPNRRLLFDYLHRAVAAAVAGGPNCAALQVDLDGFKPVNDAHGHAAGDAVLCAVAVRLREMVRGRDIVARIGGDEFAVVIEGADSNGAAALAERIAAAVRQPIAVGDSLLSVGASVGIALCPDHATQPASLLRAADLAMYEEKRLRHHGVNRHDPPRQTTAATVAGGTTA